MQGAEELPNYLLNAVDFNKKCLVWKVDPDIVFEHFVTSVKRQLNSLILDCRFYSKKPVDP